MSSDDEDISFNSDDDLEELERKLQALQDGSLSDEDLDALLSDEDELLSKKEEPKKSETPKKEEDLDDDEDDLSEEEVKEVPKKKIEHDFTEEDEELEEEQLTLIEKLRGKIKTLMMENDKLIGDIEEYKAKYYELKEQKTDEAEIQELEEQLEDITTRAEEEFFENAKLAEVCRKTSEANKKIEEEYNKLLKEVGIREETHKAQLTDIQKKILEECKNSLSEKKRLTNLSNQLKSQYENLEKENFVLKHQVKEIDDEISVLQSTKESHTTVIANNKSFLANERKNNENAVQKLEGEIKVAEEELQSEIEVNNTKQQTIDELQSNIKQLTEENTSYQEKVEESSRKLRRLEREQQRMKAQLEKLEKENKEFQREKESLSWRR